MPGASHRCSLRLGPASACLTAFTLLALFLTPVSGRAENSLPCGEGLSLRLSSQTPVQGSVVLVEVESAAPLAELKAAWAGQELHFWRTDSPASRFAALLGVDLERPTGGFPLTVQAQLESGARQACSALATVQDGHFAVERLRLPDGFVELSPQDQERAERETQKLLEIFSRAGPERLWQGGFRPPLADAEATGRFGSRRILNQQARSPHGGEDYSAPAGTPVHAAQRGRVVLAEALFFSGNTVVLDHGLGLYTFYGHLESIAVKDGQVVEAGAPLGAVGATGRVTGAHLHWAARLNLARVNPQDLVTLLAE